MTNEEIFEEFGFIIEDSEFRKNYMHLLTPEFLGQWIEIFGEPSEFPNQPEYYLRLSFGLVGHQITKTLNLPKD